MKFKLETSKWMIISLILIFAIACSIYTGHSGLHSFELRKNNPLVEKDVIQDTIKFQKALRAIYKEVNPSVVRIETEDTVDVRMPDMFSDPVFRRFFGVPDKNHSGKQKRQGLGSGFILDKNGYIVTNHHVVGKENGGFVDKIKVKLTNNRIYKAKPIGSDPVSDLALLKIEAGNDEIKPIIIGDSDTVETGDLAIAIGNPFGLSSTFTFGFISSSHQQINSDDGVSRIQTDAAINPGNSGGPLLNIKGEVIGINQMIYSRSGGSNGIGFAIPVNYAINVLKKLHAGKKITWGFIGVAIDNEPSGSVLKELGYQNKKGVLIQSIIVGSPAWKGGLRAWDMITHINGQTIDSFSKLKNTITKAGVGASLKIKILRGKQTMEKKVVVGEKDKSGK